LRNKNADAVVGGHSPTFSRMRLADVDREELDVVAVALVDFFQDPKLGSVGSSGKAAEDQHHRFSGLELRQLHFALAVLRAQPEVGSALPDARPFKRRAEFSIQ